MRLLSAAFLGGHPLLLPTVRQFSTALTLLQQAVSPPITSIPPQQPPLEKKEMNYCTAVNDALHHVMASNPKYVLFY